MTLLLPEEGKQREVMAGHMEMPQSCTRARSDWALRNISLPEELSVNGMGFLQM